MGKDVLIKHCLDFGVVEKQRESLIKYINLIDSKYEISSDYRNDVKSNFIFHIKIKIFKHTPCEWFGETYEKYIEEFDEKLKENGYPV